MTIFPHVLIWNLWRGKQQSLVFAYGNRQFVHIMQNNYEEDCGNFYGWNFLVRKHRCNSWWYLWCQGYKNVAATAGNPETLTYNHYEVFINNRLGANTSAKAKGFHEYNDEGEETDININVRSKGDKLEFPNYCKPTALKGTSQPTISLLASHTSST